MEAPMGASDTRPRTPRQRAREAVVASIINAEDVAIDDDWHACACEALAIRLGAGHDWHHALLGAAEKLRAYRRGDAYQG